MQIQLLHHIAFCFYPYGVIFWYTKTKKYYKIKLHIIE